MKTRVVATVMSLSVGALAQSINLTGTVVNASNGAPLQGVVVNLSNTPGPVDTTVANGTYHLSQTATEAGRHMSAAHSPEASRLVNGMLEINVTQSEPVTVEAFGMNGALVSRFVGGTMPAGRHMIDVRGNGTQGGMIVARVRQGDNTTFHRVLPAQPSLTGSATPASYSQTATQSVVFSDTLVFTQGGFVTRKLAVTATTGVKNIALTPEPTPSTVTDIDGNVYHTVTIGTQVWMVENLKTTRFSDGSRIQKVTDATTWGSMGTPAFCWYNNDSVIIKSTYGAHYNFFAVATGKLAPAGWHVPSTDEWTTLVNSQGVYGVQGGPLKETGTAHWVAPNSPATNTTGFTAVPGGTRDDASGNWFGFGASCTFWSSTSTGTATASDCRLYNSNGNVDLWGGDKRFGYSVRCIKD